MLNLNVPDLPAGELAGASRDPWHPVRHRAVDGGRVGRRRRPAADRLRPVTVDLPPDCDTALVAAGYVAVSALSGIRVDGDVGVTACSTCSRPEWRGRRDDHRRYPVVVTVTLLVIALVGTAAGLTAAAVTRLRRRPAGRCGPAHPRRRSRGAGSTGERPSLDRSLDDLERAVAVEHERRAKVARAENLLSWALGAIAHGVVIFDDRGEIAYRNDPAASFLAARDSDALVEEAITTMAADALRAAAPASSSCSARPAGCSPCGRCPSTATPGRRACWSSSRTPPSGGGSRTCAATSWPTSATS